MRYFIQLSYHGADFNGWQIQPNAFSVQEALNKALSTLLRQSINLAGCGRTDTGVHASFYIAQFDSEPILNLNQCVYKLNRILRTRIAVQRIWEAPALANVRFDALSRTYQYFIHTQNNPFRSDLSFNYEAPLDVDLMNLAAEKLFDYIDFTSFSKLHTGTKTNDCTIMYAKWNRYGSNIVFTIQANRFLRNMVRAIVGTLLEVGTQKLTVQGFCEVIERKDRSCAGTSAPARGLFLTSVEYPESYDVDNPKSSQFLDALF